MPTKAVAITMNFFVPSPRLLNLSNKLAIVCAIGVIVCKNTLPIGSSASLSFCTASLKFTPIASSTVFNSRSDRIANSSTDAAVKSSTRAA